MSAGRVDWGGSGIARIYRASLLASAVAFSALAVGFFWEMSWARNLWVWPAAYRLSNIFVSSIMAAIAAPLWWIGITGRLKAGAAGGLNLFVAFGGSAVFLAQRGSDTGNDRLTTFAIIFAVGAIAMAGGYLYSRQLPAAPSAPTPAVVRWSFLGFSVALVAVGTALVRAAPHVFPWPLPTATSVVYGWIFLGAAVYFGHGFIWPSRDNATGQLLGFLAYDLVLIGPFVDHIRTVRPEHRLSLILYLVVIIYSSVLALVYLRAEWRSPRSTLDQPTTVGSGTLDLSAN